jgi:hypothetical protein
MLAAMRAPPSAILALVALSAAAACGGAEPARPPAAHPVAAPEPAPGPAPAPATAELGAQASFGDLVRTADARLSAGALDARGECLLRAQAQGYAFDAELMPALHRFAEPLADLDAALQRARGPLRVLTAWGQVGAIEPEIGLASFTALSPQSLRAPAVALLVGEAGVYVRYGDGPAGDADGPLAIAEVTPHLLAQPRAAAAVLYVAAEDATPLARLAELLRALPHGRSIALAQLLPPGTRLPALGAGAPPQRSCPDGLPEPAAGSAEGELDPAAIVQALAPLREGARACLHDATGSARAGGRLVLALRIGPDGAVQDACLLEDAIGDAAIGACVLQSARSTRMPQPNPAGFVDVHLPLSLTPQAAPAVRPFCE